MKSYKNTKEKKNNDQGTWVAGHVRVEWEENKFWILLDKPLWYVVMIWTMSKWNKQLHGKEKGTLGPLRTSFDQDQIKEREEEFWDVIC